ncbi:MAG: zinc ABC transporter substrate-binding protein [Thermoplasmata archaeon]|nr:zinc ABC transporter substrate-binding protein [Thermoplasmata archaeon]
MTAAIVVVMGTLVAVHAIHPANFPANTGSVVPIVAAENFWGSLVAQLGGSHVSVLSIVSDPNADPHEYESNTSDAIAVSDARLVIENGAGYDNWCSQLVSASSSPGQRVLNVADLLGKPAGSNPHFWYGQSYVNTTIAAMYSELIAIDPIDQAYFQLQYAALNTSLAPVWSDEAYLHAHWGGGKAQIASTESIFEYMANSSGLDLVSPVAFMSAVSEGNDPPTQSVTEFQDQLESGNVSVLVYNKQTVTHLTDQMQAIAAQYNVPSVGVTETIEPSGETFEFWMASELSALTSALDQKVPVS